MLTILIVIIILNIIRPLIDNGLILLLIVIGSLILVGTMITNFDRATIWNKEYDIISLDYSNSLSGNFFLGSGSIDGKRLYYVYTKEGNLFKLISLDAERTYLEESEEIPSVWKLSCDEDKHRILWKIDSCVEEKVVLKIPKNSIIKEFRPN